MRRGQAARVTSLIYLTPLLAVGLEWLMFGVAPSGLGIAGVVITCAGVGLAVGRAARGSPGALPRGLRP
jgi:drug/metabolite transporter (DMT)-like permease